VIELSHAAEVRVEGESLIVAVRRKPSDEAFDGTEKRPMCETPHNVHPRLTGVLAHHRYDVETVECCARP